MFGSEFRARVRRARARIACLTLLLASTGVFAQTPTALNTADLQLYTNGKVFAAARQPDGSVIFAGYFSQVSGIARHDIAKLKPDGSLDTDWNPSLRDFFRVTALAADHDGYVYVGDTGGLIEKISGSGSGAADASWHAPSATNRITALVVDSTNDLFASGQLYDSSGLAKPVLKISSAGQIDPNWNPAFNASITSLAIDGENNLYVGGYFSQVGTASRAHLAKVATSGVGAVDATWDPSAHAASGSFISSIVADNLGSIYVGGTFTTVGGQSRNNLAKLSATGTGAADASWNPAPNGAVSALLVDGSSHVYVGGSFTSIGGNLEAYNVARISSSGGGAADATWKVATDNFGTNYVNALAIVGNGNIVIGGFFSLVAGQARHSLAVLSSNGTLSASADTINPGGIINAMAVQPKGGVILAGYFSGAGSLVRSNLLRLQPDGSVDPDWSVATDAPSGIGVESVVADNDAIYVGGEFTKVGGRPKAGIARLSTTGIPDPNWGADTDAAGGYYGVEALALAPNGSIYLGGDFLTIGGESRVALARVSPSGVLDTLWNSGANFTGGSVAPFESLGGIGAIAVGADGAVYAPHFESFYCLRKYSADGVGAIDPTWPGTCLGSAIYAMQLDQQGNLFVAGEVGPYKVSTATGALEWPTYTDLELPVTLSSVYSRNVARGTPYAMALDGNGNLFVGGGFDQIGGRSRPFLAKLSADTGVVDPDWNPEADDAVLALAPDGHGNIYVGGTFTHLGTKTLGAFGVVPETTDNQGIPDNLNQFGWTGAWYNPSESGQGIMLYTIPSSGSNPATLFGGWFSFSANVPGRNQWFAVQGPIDKSSKSAALSVGAGTYSSTQSWFVLEYAGDALITFSDCNHATLSYSVIEPGSADNGSVGELYASGTTELVRLSSNVLCTPSGDSGDPGDFALSGAWYDSTQAAGSGLMFDVDPKLGVFFAAWYVTDYDRFSINPITNNWYTLQAPFQAGMTSLKSVPMFQTSGGRFDYPGPVTNSQVGTADFTFINCNAVTMSYTFTAGASAGNQGTLNLTRGAGKPASCNP